MHPCVAARSTGITLPHFERALRANARAQGIVDLAWVSSMNELRPSVLAHRLAFCLKDLKHNPPLQVSYLAYKLFQALDYNNLGTFPFARLSGRVPIGLHLRHLRAQHVSIRHVGAGPMLLNCCFRVASILQAVGSRRECF